mgnify:CR=1 FL=1
MNFCGLVVGMVVDMESVTLVTRITTTNKPDNPNNPNNLNNSSLVVGNYDEEGYQALTQIIKAEGYEPHKNGERERGREKERSTHTQHTRTHTQPSFLHHQISSKK